VTTKVKKSTWRRRKVSPLESLVTGLGELVYTKTDVIPVVDTVGMTAAEVAQADKDFPNCKHPLELVEGLMTLGGTEFLLCACGEMVQVGGWHPAAITRCACGRLVARR